MNNTVDQPRDSQLILLSQVLHIIRDMNEEKRLNVYVVKLMGGDQMTVDAESVEEGEEWVTFVEDGAPVARVEREKFIGWHIVNVKQPRTLKAGF